MRAGLGIALGLRYFGVLINIHKGYYFTQAFVNPKSNILLISKKKAGQMLCLVSQPVLIAPQPTFF
jgi:hypothetical protein